MSRQRNRANLYNQGKTCIVCDVPIQNKSKRFCVAHQNSDLKKDKIKLVCLVCGKIFERYPSQIVAENPKCSRKCGYGDRKGKKTRTDFSKRVSDEQLVSDYAQSKIKNCAPLAIQYGMSISAVENRLHRLRIELKPYSAFRDPIHIPNIRARQRQNAARGERVGNYRRDIPLDQIRIMYDSGQTCEEIGALYNTTATVISRKLKNMGVQLRAIHGLGMRLTCSDGHISESRAEYLVDEWLTEHHIEHEIHPKLPWSKFKRADFRVGEVYIEVWGMDRVPRYIVKMNIKLREYQEHNVKVLSLKPNPIYKRNFTALGSVLLGG